MERLSSLFIVVLLIAGLSGCASIVSGGRQDVRFSSTPSGAQVSIYDEYESLVWTGATPVTANMERGSGFFRGARYRVEIELEGYETATVFITPDLNGFWYLAGNLFLGGVIGWLVVDPATGAMWNLRPEVVNARMNQSTALDNSTGVTVVLRNEVPADLVSNLESIGTLVRSVN